MIVIGLTGSMAMEKTTVANMLRDMKGVAVHCSDEAVRDLYNNAEVIDLIRRRFPATFQKKTNSIDKKKLIGLLGRDHEAWDDLEEILHPYVRCAQQKFIRDQQSLGTSIAVLDIPLLFETGGEQRVDFTLCVSAPEFIQRQRIEARIRDGKVSEEDAAFRLSRQMPDAEKRARADFTIPTGTSIAETRKALEKTLAEIKKTMGGPSPGSCRFPPRAL